MSNYALITGASGGIGEALAHQFAQDGIPLILVARSADGLKRVKNELVSTYDVDVVVHACDLSKQNAAQQLHSWTQSQKLTVDYLVNNAGFGDRARVVVAELGRLEDMISLNVESLVALSKLYGGDMVTHKRGNIVNIASLAGFVPGPGMAVYYATKAFVLSFSQALAAELEPSGITVTVVCPGATKSGFARAAHAENTRLFRGKLPTSDQVARFTYKSMQRGNLVAVWGTGNRIAARFVSLAPRWQLLRVVRRLQ